MKKSETKKDKILEAAIELFAKKGLDGTSTRDIAALSNANISLISYYFGGKEGLYKAIIENLFKKQLSYINEFFNAEEFETLAKKEKAETFLNFIDKMVEFFYGQMEDSLVSFLIREQPRISEDFTPPIVFLVRKILSSILEKDISSREIVYYSLFTAAQISAPRNMRIFIKPYGQNSYEKEDIEIIKYNVKNYLKMLYKGAGINL